MGEGSLGVQGLPPLEIPTKWAAFPSSMAFPGNPLVRPFLTPLGAGSAEDPNSGCGWGPGFIQARAEAGVWRPHSRPVAEQLDWGLSEAP